MGGERRADLVPLIGAFKLAKVVVLLAAGAAGLLASPQRLALTAARAVDWMGGLAGHDTLQRGVNRVWSLDDGSERRLAAVALVYAVVFAVEGLGLLRRKRWAEWLTVIVTASFIPFEIHELVAHPGPGKVAALVINAAIVVYLIYLRLRGRGRSRRRSGVTRSGGLRSLRGSRAGVVDDKIPPR
jgi:uncharacterized membrane protein (DUF2068 family)